MKSTYPLYFLFFSFMLSCKTPKYAHFSLRNSVWQNKGELKTNGYYFCDLNQVKGLLTKKILPHYYGVLILFQNGTCCLLSNYFKSHEQIKEYLKVHTSELGKKNKYAYWGRYIIENKQILIEYFFYNPDQQYLGIYKRIGFLCANDCFIIEKGYMVNGDPEIVSYKHYKYEFMPLIENVDSTNWMMKKRWFKIHE